MTWVEGQKLGGSSDSQPALALWNGQLCAAWKGVHGDPRMWWSKKISGAPGWTAQQNIPGASGGKGPGLAGFGDRLYMAYGPGISELMQWTSYDGTSWAQPKNVRDPHPHDRSPSCTNNPALATWPNALRMAWADGSAIGHNDLYWSELSAGSWNSARQLSHGDRTSLGPAAAVFNGQLYLVWRGMDYTDERIFWATAGQVPPFSIQKSQVVPGVGSSDAPALAVGRANPRDPREYLFMAWKGARAGLKDDQYLYWTFFDGTNWAPQQQMPVSRTSAGPAIAIYGMQLWMVWRGVNDDETLWYSYYKTE